MDTEKFINQYWVYITTQNERELEKFFHKDACIRWHNTNEQFNVSEFIRANCDYPGTWNGEIERIEQIENTIITVTRVWNNEISFHVTSFFGIECGKIKIWMNTGVMMVWLLSGD